MEELFTIHEFTNCFEGHGAFEIKGVADGGRISDAASPSQCASACLLRQECQGFVLAYGTDCYLRGPISLDDCSTHNQYAYDTYVRSMPPPPPSGPSMTILNSYNPGSDPEYRKCWLKKNHVWQPDDDVHTHVYHDETCTAGVHGCGAYGVSQCRFCGFGPYPACPYDTKRLLVLGNSLSWSSSDAEDPTFSVPRMLHVLAPFFGYHASVYFNSHYKWGLCNHALCHQQGRDFGEQCRVEDRDMVAMQTALIGGKWDEVLVQPQSTELLWHPNRRNEKFCTPQQLMAHNADAVWEAGRCESPFRLGCHACFSSGGTCGVLGASDHLLQLTTNEGGRLSFLPSWSPSPSKISSGFLRHFGINTYTVATESIALGASHLLASIRGLPAARDLGADQRPIIVPAFQSSYECMNAIPAAMKATYIEDDRHYRGGVGDTILALTILSSLLNLSSSALLEAAPSIAANLHTWFQNSNYKFRASMSEEVIMELVRCTAHPRVVAAREGLTSELPELWVPTSPPPPPPPPPPLAPKPSPSPSPTTPSSSPFTPSPPPSMPSPLTSSPPPSMPSPPTSSPSPPMPSPPPPSPSRLPPPPSLFPLSPSHLPPSPLHSPPSPSPPPPTTSHVAPSLLHLPPSFSHLLPSPSLSPPPKPSDEMGGHEGVDRNRDDGYGDEQAGSVLFLKLGPSVTFGLLTFTIVLVALAICHLERGGRSWLTLDDSTAIFPTGASDAPISSITRTARSNFVRDGLLDGDSLATPLREHAGFSSLGALLPSSPDAAVISTDPSRKSLTHAALRAFVTEEIDFAYFGVGRNERIAVLLPNGPESAVAIVTVLNYCTCAPLNPAATSSEITAELKSLRAKAVLLLRGGPDSLVQVAKSLELVVLEVAPSAHTTGLFTIECTSSGKYLTDPLERTPSRPDDCALVLHTSGSTGTKKIVPHTLEELVVGVVCLAAASELCPEDICCNLMPLYHVGGICRNVLCPILTGGAVVALPVFQPHSFWRMASEYGVTWYYAGPTMHQLLHETFKSLSDPPKIHLRLIANAAGPLSHQLAVQMQDTYSTVTTAAAGCRVLPSYGMTECMPIAFCRSLDRLGSSGQICGPTVQIHSRDGEPCVQGDIGRIVLRGHLVMKGYELNEEANRSSFVHGWFDTGDLGWVDNDGFLYITGRSKEVINRGGELISPMEIQDALRTHPSVRAALAFSTPHDILQETIGVMIVCEATSRPSLKTLQQHISHTLHYTKWPQLLVYASALPTTLTGKTMATSLSERLGLSCISDTTSLHNRHFQVPRMVDAGAPISMPIYCESVEADAEVDSELPQEPDGKSLAVTHSMSHTPADSAARDTGGSFLVIVGLVNELSVGSRQAGADDRLSECGITSLGMIRLIQGLKNAFPDVEIPQLLIAQDPTLRQLCAQISTDEHAGDKQMTFEAVFGLRSFLSLWIVRSHISRVCAVSYYALQAEAYAHARGLPDGGFSDARASSPWADLDWVDVQQDWRVSIFLILFAMTTSMQADAQRVSSWKRVRDFVLPLLPVVWLTLLIMYPMQLTWTRLKCLEQGPCDDDVYTQHAMEMSLTTWLGVGSLLVPTFYVPGGIGAPRHLNYIWYLGAQGFGLFCFNLLQDWSKGKKSLPLASLLWKLTPGGWFNRWSKWLDAHRVTGVPRCKHTTQLKWFLLRLSLYSLLPVLLINVLKSIAVYHSEGVGLYTDEFDQPDAGTAGNAVLLVEEKAWWLWVRQLLHLGAFARLPECMLGIVLGQGCLFVSLGTSEYKSLGRAADLVFVFVAVLSFIPPSSTEPSEDDVQRTHAWSYYTLELTHAPLMSFFVFVLCRAPQHSFAARLLRSSVFAALSPYTLGIYLMHMPVITWASFVNTFHIENAFGGTWLPYQAPFAFMPPKGEGSGLFFSFDYTRQLFSLTASKQLKFLQRRGPFLTTPDGTLFNVGMQKYLHHEIDPLLRPSGCGLHSFDWVGILAVSVLAGIVAVRFQRLTVRLVSGCCMFLSGREEVRPADLAKSAKAGKHRGSAMTGAGKKRKGKPRTRYEEVNNKATGE